MPAAVTTSVRSDRRSSDNRFYRQMQSRPLSQAVLEQMKANRARFAAEPQRKVRGAELAIPTGRQLTGFPIISTSVATQNGTSVRPQETMTSIRAIIGDKGKGLQMRTARKI